MSTSRKVLLKCVNNHSVHNINKIFLIGPLLWYECLTQLFQHLMLRSKTIDHVQELVSSGDSVTVALWMGKKKPKNVACKVYYLLTDEAQVAN